ncbi:MAG: hypothetical protein AVDCRST_MAG73-1902, partial [uncultured Thermomicrobiales bacterium]
GSSPARRTRDQRGPARVVGDGRVQRTNHAPNAACADGVRLARPIIPRAWLSHPVPLVSIWDDGL